jgi:hypothetical protein
VYKRQGGVCVCVCVCVILQLVWRNVGEFRAKA